MYLLTGSGSQMGGVRNLGYQSLYVENEVEGLIFDHVDVTSLSFEHKHFPSLRIVQYEVITVANR